MVFASWSHVTFHLYSCGYEKLGMHRRHTYTDAKYWEIASKRINDKLKTHNEFCAVISLTDRCRDPSEDASLRGCWGENAKILRQFLESKACHDALGIMKDNLVLDPDTHAKELHLAFMCKSGRHRSVAMTRIAGWILKDLGYTVTETKHVNRDKWHNLCTRCFHCTDKSFAMKQVIRRDAIATFAAI